MIEHIARLARGESLGDAEAAAAMETIVRGDATPVQIAGFIVALRTKGETVEEITGLARTMRTMATPISAGAGLLDTCGTGGDGLNTFNISTLSAVIAAACGARVAKHGNRAASSACGSADVLEALGVRIDLGPEGVAACIDQAGIGFLFAPRFHPSFRYAAVVRRELGIRTVFNILGPLSNPAGADRQALGVPEPALAPKLSQVLANLGVERSLVFCGSGGMDELSTSGPSLVIETLGGARREYELDPGSLGLERAPIEALRGGTAAGNAELARRLLDGEPGPRRDVLLLNSAAALIAADLAGGWREGLDRAADAVDSGRAAGTLRRWIEISQACEVPAR